MTWILCIYKWVIFGGHLDFAARKPKEVVSTEKKCDYVRRKMIFVVIFFNYVILVNIFKENIQS